MIRPTCFVAVLAAVLVLTACSTTAAEPDASESASATATAAGDDIAAAKGALLAYVSASNGVNLADSDSFDAVYATITGDQLANEKTALEDFHTNSWTKSGDALVTFMSDTDGNSAIGRVELRACIDSSGVVYRNADGEVMVPTNGAYNVPMTVVAERGTDDVWRIGELTRRTEDESCS